MSAERTHPSLIVRLSDPHDALAWEDFLAIYEPMLFHLTRSWGLQESDARDVVQEVLIAVAVGVHRFQSDPTNGTFRGWLSRIARNKFVDHLNLKGRHPESQGGTDAMLWLSHQPDPSHEDSLWELELRRRAFQRAAEQVQRQVRPETWQSFYRTAVLGETVAEVASCLSIQEGMVYVARSRVLARLKKLTQEWLNDDAM